MPTNHQASAPKAFSLGAALSLTTGIMLSRDGAEMQHLASFLLGFEVWSQALPRVADDLKRRTLAQHPGLPTDITTVGTSNWEAFLAEQERKFGKTLIFIAGDLD